MGTESRNIKAGIFWMFLIPLLLFWLPFINGISPLIAGLVGGWKAGGVRSALIAVFFPVIVFGFFFYSIFGARSSTIDALVVTLVVVGLFLIGAITGGLFAHFRPH